MQNDYNPQFNLSIETHEGVKHLHPLNADEIRTLSKFALSATPRKQIMRNFFHSIENQPSEKFAHIQKWIEGILAGDKTKFFTVQIDKIDQPQAEIPEFLRCDPRTYKVKLNNWHNDTCELEFTVVIKCTDEALHEHNKFWCEDDYRLDMNDGDIVAVILKMIGRKVFWWCYEHNSNSIHEKYGVNSIFKDEGWSSLCFEITEMCFDNYVDDDAFEFEPVQPEGASS